MTDQYHVIHATNISHQNFEVDYANVPVVPYPILYLQRSGEEVLKTPYIILLTFLDLKSHMTSMQQSEVLEIPSGSSFK